MREGAKVSVAKLFNPGGRAGTVDPVTGRMFPEPWQARTDDGVFVGLNDELWMYWVMPSLPFRHEDPETQLAIGSPFHELMMDIGSTSRRPVGGLSITADNRELHLLGVQWEEVPAPPAGSSDRLAAYLRETFQFVAGRKAVFVGVKLRRGGMRAAEGNDSVGRYLQHLVKQSMRAGPPPLSEYRPDRDRMASVLARNGCRRGTDTEYRMLESWVNMGDGLDNCTIIAEPSGKKLTCDAWPDGLEFRSVIEFERLTMPSPSSAWVADAFSHPDGAICVSVRGELMPADVARNKMRAAQRKAVSQYAEQQKTGDLERKEDTDRFQMGKSLEDYFVDGTEPLIWDCSIIMARSAANSDDTYADMLKSRYGIRTKPLEMRQMSAFEETLPCSSKRLGRVKPYQHALSVPLVAYSGLSAFSHLGDERGLYMGLALPDYTPIFLDPEAAATDDQSPGMTITGDPGSGKTFLAQLLCYQATLQGHTTIMINPKSASSLAPFAEAAGGRVLSLRDLENEGGGALDPGRYCSRPDIAAEIATGHILSLLTELSERQRVELSAGLLQGFKAGATCVGHALDHVADNDTVGLIKSFAAGSPLFALGVGFSPLPPLGIGAKGAFTLIEFDRPLALPSKPGKMREYDHDQRLAVATMRLVTRACLEILLSSKGGVLCVDEAWTFLSSSEGLAALTQIGREGRSQAILPIMVTQKISDLVKEGVELETFISRVVALKSRDPKEAAEAIRLVGLDPTPERKSWLARAGHKRPTPDSPGRGALGFIQDMQGRRCAFMVGPVPPWFALTASTNKLDIETRQRNATGGGIAV